jgi:hypothetical protein
MFSRVLRFDVIASNNRQIVDVRTSISRTALGFTVPCGICPPLEIHEHALPPMKPCITSPSTATVSVAHKHAPGISGCQPSVVAALRAIVPLVSDLAPLFYRMK